MSRKKLSRDHVLRGLDELRDQKLLCDVHLVADGAKFPAHRVVLAAASPYFQAMFTGGFKENLMNEITLNNISSQGLKCVLDAIYTAELRLSKENVCNVLPVASQLQLNEIVEHCEGFLVANVSAQNCLSFLSAAEKFDLQEAVDACNNFVLENFGTISESMEFTNLSKKQLCTYLAEDRLKTSNGEIDVFRATFKWFEANRNTTAVGYDSSDLYDLMQHVRFPLIASDLLLDEILTCNLILENPQVMRMVREALQFHSDDKVFLQPLQEGKQFRPRGEQILALITSTLRPAGQSLTINESKLHLIRGTDSRPFHTRYFKQVIPITFVPCSISVVTRGNYIFLFGAEAEYFREIAVRFDVKTNTWLDLKSPPHKASIGIAVALLRDNIYLMGGMHVTKDRLNSANAYNAIISDDISGSVSHYSIETNSWSKVKNLPRPLVYHSAASHDKYVFCAGGYLTDSSSTFSSDKLYAFDVVGKIWLSKASMNDTRVKFGMEAVEGKLIACGGIDVANVEIYDIADDQWTLITEWVLENHYSPATVALDDRVYVIGGSAKDADGTISYRDYVSIVDANNAKKRRVSSFPFSAMAHKCTLLTVPHTAPRADMFHVSNN